MFKLVLFLFLSLICFSQNISSNTKAYIGSFNALHLGKSKKDYVYLAKVIEGFDLIGIVEVMNKNGLFKLLSEVEKISGVQWDYNISPYPVGTDFYKEYYAFLYRKDRVKFVKTNGFYPDKNDDFIREPYGATFKINNFDFTFILLHSIYGKKISQREFEGSKVVDVYNYFQNQFPNENDILIGGDFNISADNSSFKELFNHKDQIIYCIDTAIKTTIGNKGFVNSYDNIFLSKLYTTEFKGVSGALNIIKNDYKTTRKEVSDHIPIFILVDTEVDDD